MPKKKLSKEELEQLRVNHPEIYKKLVPARTISPRWGKNTNPTYYTEHHAKDVKPYIERLIKQDGDSLLVPKDQFVGMAVKSIMMKFKQAFGYMIDFMDDDHQYKCLENLIKFRATREGVLISISFNVLTANNSDVVPDYGRGIGVGNVKNDSLVTQAVMKNTDVTTDNTPIGWRGDLEEFVDNPAIESFHRNGLNLDENDKEYARSLLECIPSVEVQIGSSFIKADRVHG